MKIFRQLIFTLLGFFLISSSNVFAGLAQPVMIDEYFDGFDGEFVVHSAESSIFAFAVANDTAVDSWSDFFSWQSTIADETQWNANGVFGFTDGWTSPDTSLIGFQSLFGPASQAIVYWTGGGALDEVLGEEPLPPGVNPILPFSTVGGFRFSSQFAASPFVTFGQNGEINGQGQTNVIPVPAAAWLFGSGLLGLVGIARRRG